MPESGYSKLQKWYHFMTVGSKGLSEISFDLEQTIFNRKIPPQITDAKHLFITGFARCGTTALLSTLHNTGIYTSLTYAEMPLILAPNLGDKILPKEKRQTLPKERAHKDGILIDNQSPEALDEVFWKVFLDDNFIHGDRLSINMVPKELLTKYEKYIKLVLLKNYKGTKLRYLSKNNNNVLRLQAIINYFPRATVIIPFRDPLQHALSLHHQHRHFCKIHQKGSFSLRYMNWLGHHEFGLNQKPFFLNNQDLFDQMVAMDKEDINYWLLSWLNYYSYVLRQYAKSCLLFSYERFCEAPNSVMKHLMDRLGILDYHFSLSPFTPETRTTSEADPKILNECRQVYDQLNDLAAIAQIQK